VCTVAEKIETAKTKIKLLHNDICSILELHEGNAIVNYSKLLSKQIPSSHAAWAFKTLQDAMIQSEIIGVCRVWDTNIDSISIPAITQLLEDKDVLPTLFSECCSQWSNDSIFANSHCSEISVRFSNAIKKANSVTSSQIHPRLQNLRNKSLAHLTTESYADKKRAKQSLPPIPNALYGDERELLEDATEIIESYYLYVNAISFSMTGHRAMFRRRAEAFWHGVSIKVLR
jgi:hypothetical protein